MRRLALVVLVIVVAAGGGGWLVLRPRPTDEERIYRLVADAARAVEMRNPSGVLKLISESYQDPYGNNKRALAQQVIAGLRATERHTVVPEVAALQVSGDAATAEVRAKVWFGDPAGSPGTDLAVKLRLAREGRRWLVTSAEGWQEAEEAYMNRGGM